MPRSLSLMVLAAFLACSAAAQSPESSSPPPAASSPNPAPPADPAKPKKVWTNENLAHTNGPVSVVGNSNSNPKSKPTAEKPVDTQYIASVRKQLEKLQEQITEVDKQLVDLKNFSSGEPSSTASGIKLNKSFDRDPIQVQIRELQDKKKDLEAKTDALLDEARKRGVEPGQLR
jgi:hypothetical protein